MLSQSLHDQNKHWTPKGVFPQSPEPSAQSPAPRAQLPSEAHQLPEAHGAENSPGPPRGGDRSAYPVDGALMALWARKTLGARRTLRRGRR